MEHIKSLSNDVEKYKFPEELLQSSAEARKNYFDNFTVSHKFLEEAISSTISFITSHVSERLVFICGPSGVGKKELIKAIKERIIELKRPELIENPGCVPVIDVEALAPEQGSFNFRNLWISALEKLNEPMIENKVSYRKIEGFDAFGRSVPISRIQKADYQEILQKTLRYRAVGALIIDEAHHMLRVSSGKKINWSADLLKSLTNASQTPVVLVGTYELTTFLEDIDKSITDQINQRTKIVHFRHYSCKDRDEVMIFGKTTKKLLLHLPLEQTAEKLADEKWKYLYKYSLGCIGTLKIWLKDAYSLALEEKAKTLTIEHLEKSRKSGHTCSALLQSIEEGESIMEKILSEGNIEEKLGFERNENKSRLDRNIGNSRAKLKPFERNPKRDIVNNR